MVPWPCLVPAAGSIFTLPQTLRTLHVVVVAALYVSTVQAQVPDQPRAPVFSEQHTPRLSIQHVG
jgi:Na+-translocating ferredoxin:NAD+ oxidoreductase RnfE subunit